MSNIINRRVFGHSYEWLLDDMTSKQVVFSKRSYPPSTKIVIFRRSSTFFLDVLWFDLDDSTHEGRGVTSFMIGPFQSYEGPMEVNVEVKLYENDYFFDDVCIKSAMMGDKIIPVVQCPRYVFDTTTNFLNIERPVDDFKTLKKRDKDLIDISNHLKSYLGMETKKRIEMEKALEELQTALQDKLEVEENLRHARSELEKLHEKLQIEREEKEIVSKKNDDQICLAEFEELQTALRNVVQKAEKELADMSKQHKDSLNVETSRRIEVEEELHNERCEHQKLEREFEELMRLLETTRKQIKLGESSNRLVNLTEFSLSEINDATNNLDNSKKIGEGGFGSVYKGFLRHTNVAIKVLNPDSYQGDIEIDFKWEVEILTMVRHPNIVSLIGSSLEARALIYEFLPNGSLDVYLTNDKYVRRKLSWQNRIRVASEICSALIFLHSVGQHGIVHGDLKPENILLDSGFVSKIIDFGISREMQKIDQRATLVHLTKIPKFTGPYADPEFLSSYELTPQYDIYSYGIILLQLVTGTGPKQIKDRVDEALELNEFDKMVDESAGKWPIEVAKKLAMLGLWCSTQSRRKRPSLVRDVWPEIESMKDVAGL